MSNYTVTINKYFLTYHSTNEQGEQVMANTTRWVTEDALKELTDTPPLGVDMVTYTFMEKGIAKGEPINPSWVGSLVKENI